MRVGALLSTVLVNLIEHAALGEESLVCVGPIRRDLVDGEQLDFGECVRVSGKHVGVAWAVMVLGDDFLPCIGVEELEIGLGDFSCPATIDVLVHDGDRRLGANAQRGIDDLQLAARLDDLDVHGCVLLLGDGPRVRQEETVDGAKGAARRSSQTPIIRKAVPIDAL